jgi:SAM-dependent methyltransferase
MDQFWLTQESDNHIAVGDFNPIPMVRRLWTEWGLSSDVFDFGCGYGRLCPAFNPRGYFGYDINKQRLDEAKELYPEYEFGEYVEHKKILFAYTVFMHMEDDEIEEAISIYKPEVVVISEVMGEASCRVNSRPKVNRRNPEEYARILKMKHHREYFVIVQRYASKPRHYTISLNKSST